MQQSRSVRSAHRVLVPRALEEILEAPVPLPQGLESLRNDLRHLRCGPDAFENQLGGIYLVIERLGLSVFVEELRRAEV